MHRQIFKYFYLHHLVVPTSRSVIRAYVKCKEITCVSFPNSKVQLSFSCKASIRNDSCHSRLIVFQIKYTVIFLVVRSFDQVILIILINSNDLTAMSDLGKTFFICIDTDRRFPDKDTTINATQMPINSGLQSTRYHC